MEDVTPLAQVEQVLVARHDELRLGGLSGLEDAVVIGIGVNDIDPARGNNEIEGLPEQPHDGEHLIGP